MILPSYQPPQVQPGSHTLAVRQAVSRWWAQVEQQVTQNKKVPGKHTLDKYVLDKHALDKKLDKNQRRHQDLRGTEGSAELICGVSGGGDSLALLCAVDYHCRRGTLPYKRVRAVIVDHGLQEGSDEVAQATAQICTQLGIPSEVLSVASSLSSADQTAATHLLAAQPQVAQPVQPAQPQGNVEAWAREQRYRLLGSYAQGRPLLIAHTQDEDVEGFFLALHRGSGSTALAGMRPLSWDHPATHAGASWVGRPLLTATRANTQGSCAELGISPWQDPQNEDRAFLRSRIRHDLIPQVVDIVGASFPDAVAKSRRQLRIEEDYMEKQAAEALSTLLEETQVPQQDSYRTQVPQREWDSLCAPLNCKELKTLDEALLPRVIRLWLAPVSTGLTQTHLSRIRALVKDWKGQGGVAIPAIPGGDKKQTDTPGNSVRRRSVLRDSGFLVVQDMTCHILQR